MGRHTRDVTEPVFATDGEHFVPTPHAAGPWDPRYQHGGAVSGLVARVAEGREFEQPMHVARITIDLLRPIPVEPLALDVDAGPSSRNVARTDVRIRHGDDVLAEARVVHIRAADLDHDDVEPPRHERPGPDDGEVREFPGGFTEGEAFHRTGMELRFVKGGFHEAGPSSAWFRFRRPLVDDEPPTPLQTVAAACDFGNGISWALPADRYVFINPDLTIHLARLPVGEWVGLTSLTVARPNGTALAESTLFDDDGRVGRSVQSLFVDARR